LKRAVRTHELRHDEVDGQRNNHQRQDKSAQHRMPVLGERRDGEEAEFDTLNPHWFGSVGTGDVEILSMFGKQGQRIHLRAKSAQKARA
jgi:hypothetical protein